MKLREAIGIDDNGENIGPNKLLVDRIKLQLIMLGFHVENVDEYTKNVVSPVINKTFHGLKKCNEEQCGADKRIEQFLNDYLSEFNDREASERFLPERDFICDKYGMARVLSLPEGADEFHSEYVDSYRTCNGILNNPSTDKRTTKDVFHIVEGGYPVPDDKIEVPKIAFYNMLKIAFHPNDKMLMLPFTSLSKSPVETFISNYMTPIVCPAMPGIQKEKRMEVRFFVPASLVSILDFTESIFGNAGSPFSVENDMAYDPQNWSGYTGCIVFAPQLRKCTKKELGLPNIGDATNRQKKDGMCWEHEDELYHDGKPFKIMARDGRKVIVSIVADSYNGYGKKEIKTQMSYVANMMGACEEEHSGGTLVFRRKDIGDEWTYTNSFNEQTYSYDDAIKRCNRFLEKKEGYYIDKNFNNVVFLPEDAKFCLPKLTISWDRDNKHHELPLELEHVYILPSGDRIHIERPDIKGGRWKMINTQPDGIFCYKPATVSGGGKSEIAKPIDEFISTGPTLVCNFKNDIKIVKEICSKNYSARFKDEAKHDTRSLLDGDRTLGSTIKLLTPSEYYTDEYNEWLKSIPKYILEFVFCVKRFIKNPYDENLESLFSVDIINGEYGKELKYRREKLLEHYLRVGFDSAGKWRMFSLRDDFIPSEKFQLADDITVSATLPAKSYQYLSGTRKSIKIVSNCEYRLYQRPDEAIVPGYDIGTEDEMTGEDVFTCNFKPLTRDDVSKMIKDSIRFETYSKKMQNMLKNFVSDKSLPSYAVCPSELRTMPNGNLSKNQRYLQNRADISDNFKTHLTNISLMLHKQSEADIDATAVPVDSILSGRRNNPPENNIKPLCVYSPLHYMELPELFMEYMSSMTGKSPSTTGAGLEGAMTKGPFNCLNSVYDLNNALLSFILTGYSGFLSAAGYVGPNVKVDHDITYLLPEIWCAMTQEEHTPEFLIEHKYLERCENFEHNGKIVQAERLGYRITRKFVRIFGSRVFSSADSLFTDEMLRPELQDMDIFAESMETILDAHRRAAELVIKSDEIKQAIPPLHALLYITAYGDFDGMKLQDKTFRQMFDYDYVINSDWYLERLKCYKNAQIDHLTEGRARLQGIYEFHDAIDEESADIIENRLDNLEKELAFVRSPAYLQAIIGTLGKHVQQN